MFYLYPQYNNEQEIRELRFDEVFIQEELNLELMGQFTERMQSKVVRNRVNLLLKSYNLCLI